MRTKQRGSYLLSTLLNRSKTTPLILVLLGLCSCGNELRSLPLSNLDTSVAALYSIDGENHRVLRYTPNDVGTAVLDSSINLPAGMTATLIATDATGNLHIGGYTDDVDHAEVLIYDSAAKEDDQPLRILTLVPGKLTALAIDRQGAIYTAQASQKQAVIHIYSPNAGEDTPIRSIAPAAFADLYDLAVDSAGDVFVSGTDGSTSFIREFSPAATGDAAAMRTVVAPEGVSFGGLAVDDSGEIFVMMGQTICKIAPGENEPKAIQAINLPVGYTASSAEAFPNVLRRDGLGDFFVPVRVTATGRVFGSLDIIYGFALNAGGDAIPMLQFIAEEAAASGPREHNVPLAVF
jgi:hypothetical protein